jgi:hypothetical protein
VSGRKPKSRKKAVPSVAELLPRDIPVDRERAERLLAQIDAGLVAALSGLSTPADAHWLVSIAWANRSLKVLLLESEMAFARGGGK